MAKPYQATDWYWIVGGEETRVFASARSGYIPADDAAYAAFLVDGNFATRIDTEASLAEVLAPHGIFVDLAVYANTKQWALATGGYTLTLSGQPLTFATDTASQALITGKYIRLTQPNPPATISWQFPGGFVSIAQADFAKVASAIADFIQATFDALEAVFAAIKAGTITTLAEVDAAAWPSAVAA